MATRGDDNGRIESQLRNGLERSMELEGSWEHKGKERRREESGVQVNLLAYASAKGVADGACRQ
jgi:hypothetical protein